MKIDLRLLIAEPAEVYHSKRDSYLSSHQLLDYQKSPWLYHKKASGLIPDADSTSFVVGRAAHTRILEGFEVFKCSYAVGGPINPTTGRPFGAGTKAFTEWVAKQGKPVLTHDQEELIEQLWHGVEMNDAAVNLLNEGVAEGVVRTKYAGMSCQIRIDWLNPAEGIVDLKTCDDLTWFEGDARRYGYERQLAFYRAVLGEALDGLKVPVHIIAVEKREPFRAGVWRVSEETLEAAERQNLAAIERLKSSYEDMYWPTGFEDVRILDIQ